MTTDRREEVESVLASLLVGEKVERAQIRRMGRIAESLGIERRFTETYDEYLWRILKRLEKKDEGHSEQHRETKN